MKKTNKKIINTESVGKIKSISLGRCSEEVVYRWTGYINSYIKENNLKLRAEANYKRNCVDIYEIKE